MRGGTSKGLFFHECDLPQDHDTRNAIFLSAIGSPDPYGRQLDGLGGGISSLSKVAVIGPPTVNCADVDYTFGQVAVKDAAVDYQSTCGNLASAVGPFALDEGLVTINGTEAFIRIHATNTRKLIVAHFPTLAGEAAVDGQFELAGVGGSGARIRLEFLDPGGTATGRLLPTGRPRDELDVPGVGQIGVSLVDATNPCAFVDARDLGLVGTEYPDAIEGNGILMRQLEAIRAAAGVAMGLGGTPEEIIEQSQSSPKVAFVAPPGDTLTLADTECRTDAMDITVRMLSMGVPHRAVPLTGAMCLAVAASIEDSIPHRVRRMSADPAADIRIGTPSGILPVGASVIRQQNWIAERVIVYRTARRLMEGSVLVRTG